MNPLVLNTLDLSKLLFTLENTNDSGELVIQMSGEALIAMKACLQSTLSHIKKIEPHEFNPRLLPHPMKLARPPLLSKHLGEYIETINKGPEDLVDMDKDLFHEATAWHNYIVIGRRLEAIGKRAEEIIQNSKDARVQVPQWLAQTIVDVCSLIQRREPNEIATQLNDDVSKHNEIGLLTPIIDEQGDPF